MAEDVSAADDAVVADDGPPGSNPYTSLDGPFVLWVDSLPDRDRDCDGDSDRDRDADGDGDGDHVGPDMIDRTRRGL